MVDMGYLRGVWSLGPGVRRSTAGIRPENPNAHRNGGRWIGRSSGARAPLSGCGSDRAASAAGPAGHQVHDDDHEDRADHRDDDRAEIERTVDRVAVEERAGEE